MPFVGSTPTAADIYPPRWSALPRKIVDVSTKSLYPKAPFKRSDNTWGFLYFGVSGSTYSIREASSSDGETGWTTALVYSTAATLIGLGAGGYLSTGTTLVNTSDYKLPYPSTPNGAVRTWRKPSGGAWTEVGTWPKPTGDNIFVPFGRFVELAGGTIRATGCGWDAARTYAHIYYVDSTDDGLTWGNLTTIYNGNTPTGANELCYAVNPANTAQHLVVSRREDEYGTHEGGMRVFVSASSGASGTWAELGEIPAIVARYATAPDLFNMSDGRLVLLYGDRGAIATYGSGAQHTMRMVVGYWSSIFSDINAWSSSVILQNTYPQTNGDSGYGALFKLSSLDSSLNMVWFDGLSTDTDIWQAGIGDMFPVGYR